MEDENGEQPRELNRWLASLLIALAGIVGGASGVFTALSWLYIIPAIFGLNRFTASLYFMSPALIVIMGPMGAVLGGWAAGHYIDKFERRPVQPKFRDNRAGGVITLIIKVITWVVFLLIIGVLVLLTRRR